jgi:hypothetical protein
MAENNDIFNRADSLMTRSESNPLGGKRRRSFVAATVMPTVMPKLEEIHFAAPLAVDDEDLPVLTEEVSAEAAISVASPDRFDETLVSILAADIAHAIEQQMSIELPMLIEASLLTIKDDLRAGISATMDVALRNFLARRQQLRLPFNDPNRDD